MSDSTSVEMRDYFLQLADSELVLGHRNSEWTGHAPILEEDIAIANISLDEIGHARLWYRAVSDLSGEDPDRLAFFRNASQFRSSQLVEQPKGDWAFTILRQFLADSAERLLLTHLATSNLEMCVDLAAKIAPEETYHFRHSRSWVKRLALGTAESRRRMQDALDTLWPLTSQIFPSPSAELAASGATPDSAELFGVWADSVESFLTEVSLVTPGGERPVHEARSGHSKSLAPLLAEMQEVAHLEEGAAW